MSWTHKPFINIYRPTPS